MLSPLSQALYTDLIYCLDVLQLTTKCCCFFLKENPGECVLAPWAALLVENTLPGGFSSISQVPLVVSSWKFYSYIPKLLRSKCKSKLIIILMNSVITENNITSWNLDVFGIIALKLVENHVPGQLHWLCLNRNWCYFQRQLVKIPNFHTNMKQTKNMMFFSTCKMFSLAFLRKIFEEIYFEKIIFLWWPCEGQLQYYQCANCKCVVQAGM